MSYEDEQLCANYIHFVYSSQSSLLRYMVTWGVKKCCGKILDAPLTLMIKYKINCWLVSFRRTCSWGSRLKNTQYFIWIFLHCRLLFLLTSQILQGWWEKYGVSFGIKIVRWIQRHTFQVLLTRAAPSWLGHKPFWTQPCIFRRP